MTAIGHLRSAAFPGQAPDVYPAVDLQLDGVDQLPSDDVQHRQRSRLCDLSQDCHQHSKGTPLVRSRLHLALHR